MAGKTMRLYHHRPRTSLTRSARRFDIPSPMPRPPVLFGALCAAAALAIAPAALAEESTCCRFSARFDAFQLVFRRVAFEGEMKIAGPFTIGVEPAWIWGGSTDRLDEQGLQLLGFFAWHFYGGPLRGFWLRAVGGFEAFDATLTHSKFEDVEVKKGIASGIFGLTIGDSVVFGQNGGFTLSGGIGIGFATSDKTQLVAVSPDPDVPNETATYYDGADRLKLLGSLGLGVTF